MFFVFEGAIEIIKGGKVVARLSEGIAEIKK